MADSDSLSLARSAGLAAPRLHALPSGSHTPPLPPSGAGPLQSALLHAHHKAAVVRTEVRAALHRVLDPHLGRLAERAQRMMALAQAQLPGGAAALLLRPPRVAHDLRLSEQELATLCSVLCVRVVQLAQRAAGLRQGAAALGALPLDALRSALAAAATELHEVQALAGTVEREFAAVHSASHGRAQQLEAKTADALARARAYHADTAAPRYHAAVAASLLAQREAQERLVSASSHGQGARAITTAAAAAAAAAEAAPAPPLLHPVSESGASLPVRQGSLIALRFTPTDAALEANAEARELVQDAAELLEQQRVLFGEISAQEALVVDRVEVNMERAGAAAGQGVASVEGARGYVQAARRRLAAVCAALALAVGAALLVLRFRFGLLTR